MPQHTPLHAAHVAAGARMVDFAGWDMPVNYGSQIEEHHAVRRDAGMFDVSHMLALDLAGAGSKSFLRGLIANDVAKLVEPGKALYSCMLTPEGGVIDDLIVYYLSDTTWRIVVNAGTADKDVAWMQARLAEGGFDAALTVRRDLAMIAVQGPNARAKTWSALPGSEAASAGLKPFQAAAWGDFFIARTGYTGEDGLEIMLPDADAPAFWRELLAAGVAPTGLGARDTLRLEAGMNLYGHDMDDTISPLAAGMGWTIAWEPASRDFIGRAALEAERAAGPAMKQVGLVLESRGVLREGMTVTVDGATGVITSGTFSPTLKLSIAIARVPAATGDVATVDLRGVATPVRVVKLPFVRNGKQVYA